MPNNRFRRNMLVGIVVSFKLDNSTVKFREKTNKEDKTQKIVSICYLYSSNPIGVILLYLNNYG